MLDKRYSRNETMLSPEENRSLAGKRICVAGCGGLGGYLIELSGRLGIGTITAVDGDVFDETNLNRQLLSDETVLGKSKAETAAERMGRVNSQIDIIPVKARITAVNAVDICRGHDLILDGLDNVESRRVLQAAAEELGIPLIHGAIGGWYGQVTTILPGDRTLDLIYPDTGEEEEGANEEPDGLPNLGNPSFTPSLVASLQVAEALKVLLGKEGILRHRLLYVNTLNQEYNVLNIQS